MITSFLQLWSLPKIFLSVNHLEIIVHAFISAHFSYCNSLYVGISHLALYLLQLAQNAAARLFIGEREAYLSSLPVKCRIDFKIVLFVFEALYGQAPGYISHLLIPYTASDLLIKDAQDFPLLDLNCGTICKPVFLSHRVSYHMSLF